MGLPFFFLINLLLIAISIYLWEKGRVGDTPNPARGDPLDPLSPPVQYTFWEKGKVGDTQTPPGEALAPLSPPGLLMLHYERRSDLREAADSMKRDSLS